MDRSASSIARRIRLAREGQAEARGTLLDARRNYLRILAATCIETTWRSRTGDFRSPDAGSAGSDPSKRRWSAPP